MLELAFEPLRSQRKMRRDEESESDGEINICMSEKCCLLITLFWFRFWFFQQHLNSW